jgi:hypothetical protein
MAKNTELAAMLRDGASRLLSMRKEVGKSCRTGNSALATRAGRFR